MSTHRNKGSLEDMMQAFEGRLKELGGDVMSSCNSAVDIESDDEYLDYLCNEIESYLGTEGFDAYVYVDTDSVPEGITVHFDTADDSLLEFSIPLEDIEPNWDDISSDADTIAQDAIDFCFSET